MPRLLVVSALAFSVCTLVPAHGEAQTRATAIQPNVGRRLDDLRPGATVRLSVQGEDPTGRLRGKLQGFGQTTLLLEVRGARRELPLSSILLVEESYRDRKRGAIAGIAVALVGVYVWDFFGPHPRYTDQDKRYKENLQALGIALPASALIGYAIGWHRWRQVSTR